LKSRNLDVVSANRAVERTETANSAVPARSLPTALGGTPTIVDRWPIKARDLWRFNRASSQRG